MEAIAAAALTQQAIHVVEASLAAAWMPTEQLASVYGWGVTAAKWIGDGLVAFMTHSAVKEAAMAMMSPWNL